MRILVAPDSFKGSLSATRVAAAIERGLKKSFPAANTVCVPMADGGEGTLEVLGSHGWELVEVPVCDHHRRLVRATVARRDSVFVIESAQACRFDPEAVPTMALTASSEGVGMLIEYALDEGATDIFLTLGGTASTDGGKGMLTHLGAQILDAAGQPLPPGGGSLEKVAQVDMSRMDPRLAKVTMTVVTDVDAPLLGPSGAAHQFGPQKGADIGAVATLAAGLARFSQILGPEVALIPGAGAGGGSAYGALAGLGANAAHGASTVASIVGLDSVLRECDAVITGEGSLDDQSFGGKVVGFVCALAQERGIPVGVICGQSVLPGDDDSFLSSRGIVWLRTLMEIASNTSHAMEHSEELVQEIASQMGMEMSTS